MSLLLFGLAAIFISLNVRSCCCGLWFTPAPGLLLCGAEEAVDESGDAEDGRREVEDRRPVLHRVAVFGELPCDDGGEEAGNVAQAIGDAHQHAGVASRHVTVGAV